MGLVEFLDFFMVLFSQIKPYPLHWFVIPIFLYVVQTFFLCRHFFDSFSWLIYRLTKNMMTLLSWNLHNCSPHIFTVFITNQILDEKTIGYTLNEKETLQCHRKVSKLAGDKYIRWFRIFQTSKYQDIVKATIFRVFEDIKFKISEGSDQNWSCPESALLAVSV